MRGEERSDEKATGGDVLSEKAVFSEKAVCC